MFTIRAMTFAELAFAATCTQEEGWLSEDYTTLQTFIGHDPQGCLLAISDQDPAGSTPVGICFATPYGESGFIGELIVSPAWRGQGIGEALLDAGVRYLRSQGARTVYLDGVLKAVPLYERYGFRKLCRSLRFAGEYEGKLHVEVRPMVPPDLRAVSELDCKYFGADRSFFLRRRMERFPELAKVQVRGNQISGYILGRQGADWVAAGPWVVEESNAEPFLLFDSLAQEAAGKRMSAGVLARNEKAVAFFRSLEFTERPDSPWRMALGPDTDLGTSPFCPAVGSAAKG